MAASQHTEGFSNSGEARIVAAIFAAILGFAIWFNWADDIKALFAEQPPALPPSAEVREPAKPANPALRECLDKRVGDVDRMKEEGIISDSQYEAFRSRAVNLCRAQHPG
jgi:hypothetical protein